MQVIFIREDSFYFLELPDDDNIETHVRSNPGTKRVESIDGRVLWPQPAPRPARALKRGRP